MDISDEEKKTIMTARKYGLVPGTIKCMIFQYFDDGFSAREVFYITENILNDNKKERLTWGNTIRRYYNIREKAQSPTEKISNE